MKSSFGRNLGSAALGEQESTDDQARESNQCDHNIVQFSSF